MLPSWYERPKNVFRCRNQLARRTRSTAFEMSGPRGQLSCSDDTYPSAYCTIRPFFDHANQQGPYCGTSGLWSTRMMLGTSPCCDLGTLHTRKSPSAVCVASISVFCFDEDPCQARSVIRAGDRVVFNVCSMVNEGCSVAINIEPLR